MNIFEDYLKALKTFRISEITESTHRNKLQDLLEAIAKDINPKIKIIHEPKREGKFGSPDYKVIIADNIIGYVENKAIDEDLNKVLKSEQIEKYKNLSDNIIITNYIEFIWLKDGRVTKRDNLSYLTDFEDKKTKLDLNREEAVKELIKNFFSQAPKGISNTKKLAEALSVRAKLLKDFLFEELKRQEKEHTEGKLYGLYQTFKKYVFNDLLVEEFSDTFAQNLVYGLFLAKLNADTDNINLYNAKKYISSSFELIKELVGFLDELDKEEYLEIRWVVEEVLTVLNNLDIKAITRTLSFNANISDKDDYKVMDPYIYFYEDFLATYDKKLKKSKGVFYTPPPVVNFITRATDDILKSIFNLKDGFADHNRVTVLDFATGTGTFLLEIIKNILEKFPEDSGKKELIIKEHILKNIYGFEYLIAPYTIAHLKLSQYLKDKGYSLSNNERFQIFLTNTLEPIDKQLSIPLLPALSIETKEAQKVKDKPILVITGNPPYSGHSKNNGKWISNKIRDYFYLDGILLEEKNSKWLQDDYVKFIRFAQDKMENVKEGIVGIITNHSFLDNPTFRGMRKSLMNTFNIMYFIDLHGNKRKMEKAPEDEEDENVFDIEQGVSISILIKKEGLKNAIYRSDFWGKRVAKYKKLLDVDFKDIQWTKILPEKPYYIFRHQDNNLKKVYDKFYSIKDIFMDSGVGITTAHDEFVTAKSKSILLNRFDDFKKSNRDADLLYQKFNVRKKKGWDILLGWDNLQKIDDLQSLIKPFIYRPFDKRFIFYEDKLVWRTVKKIMQNFFYDNIALCCSRQVKNDFRHCFVIDSINNFNILDIAGGFGSGFTFPLYIYEGRNLINKEDINKKENFKVSFREYVDQLYRFSYTPEQLLGYIYSVLNSTFFRKKYLDFLKIDFPKIPFIQSRNIFEKLSIIGQELIQAHLLKNIKNYDNGNFVGKGNNKIQELRFEKDRLFINKDQYFDLVPREVFNFLIGGHQVLFKYIKDRINETITLSEIENIENIIKVLKYTIEQIEIINGLTKDWI